MGGYLDGCRGNTIMVTTTEDLQDQMTPELAAEHNNDGAKFEYVGPLLGEEAPQATSECDLVTKAHEARASGRKIIMVSLGTVVTSNHSVNGWDARTQGSKITGKQLCQAVWAGTFDAVGADTEESAPLIIAALGRASHTDALGGIEVPANATCVTSFQQVELLRVGIDLFVTHGGQNSFTEAMSFSTPVVVCPGFGDQMVNAQKAVDLGVGLKVDRPFGPADTDGTASTCYRNEVCQAITQVLSCRSWKEAAQLQAAKLAAAGGIPRAVDLILTAASKSKELWQSRRSSCSPTNGIGGLRVQQQGPIGGS